MVSSGSSGPYHVQLILFFCIHHRLLHCHPVFGCMPVSQVIGNVSTVWPVWMALVLHVAVIATVHMWQCTKLLLHVTVTWPSPCYTWRSHDCSCVAYGCSHDQKRNTVRSYAIFLPDPGNNSGKPVVGLDHIVVHCLSKGMFATTNIR